MPKPEPIPDHVRERVVELARRGVPRNQIARQTGVSATSVSRIARAAGVRFEQTVARTELATAARAAQQRAERVEEAQGVLDDLRTARGLFAAAETPRQAFDAARTVEALARAHVALVTVEHKLRGDDDGLAEARSMLEGVAALARLAAADDDQAVDNDQEGQQP